MIEELVQDLNFLANYDTAKQAVRDFYKQV